MKLKSWIYLILGIGALIVLTIANLRYRFSATNGRENNANRIKLNVPIIEKDMYQTYGFDSFFTNHWWRAEQYPKDNKPLHYLKIVSLTHSAKRVVERDLYRMKLDSGFYQLQIRTAIINNDRTGRYGVLTIPGKLKPLNISLNDAGVDSVTRAWGIE